MKDNREREFKRRLYSLILRIIKFVENCKKSQTTRIVGDQLIRSGTSILGNYIEGQSASSKKDYTNYFHHSLKSANESKVWVLILRDTGNGEKEEADSILAELDEISKIFGSSVLTLKGKRNNI
ncbi:MAG: four helix bundle protein [Patescibacteria group bacterium]|nr:four helix bundle protein [Patescibacteria group bacterium]